MVNSVILNGQDWTAITEAGKSGTCWLKAAPGGGSVVLNHSTEGPGNLEISDSYFLPKNKRVITPIGADNGADVFYARCEVPTETAVIVVDTT